MKTTLLVLLIVTCVLCKPGVHRHKKHPPANGERKTAVKRGAQYDSTPLFPKKFVLPDGVIRDHVRSGKLHWMAYTSKRATGKLPDPMPEKVILNVGCGRDVRDGLINIDMYSDDPSVVGMDLRKLDLPDNSVDGIIAQDILEHFPHWETDAVLREWARVLKPDKLIAIRVPCLTKLIEAYTTGLWDADMLSYFMFASIDNPGNLHMVAFDRDSITKHLNRAGLKVLSIVEDDIKTTYDKLKTSKNKYYPGLNMVVRAQKV